MVDAISTAVSGLNAATRKVAVAANNIANAGTTGAGDGTGAYTPQDIVQTTNGAGSVSTQIINRDPATVQAYAPNDPNAGQDGLIAVPNVDMIDEFMTIKAAEIAYKASASVIKTASKMQDDLLSAFDEKV